MEPVSEKTGELVFHLYSRGGAGGNLLEVSHMDFTSDLSPVFQELCFCDNIIQTKK